MTESMQLEWIRLDELKRWPRNPKDHDLPGIAGSVERFGFVKPILIDESSSRLVAGHGRLDAAEDLMVANPEKLPLNVKAAPDGMWMLPVIRGVEFASEAEARAFVLADNQLTIAGGWDDEALAAHETERRFAGCDLEPKWVAVALERVAALGAKVKEVE